MGVYWAVQNCGHVFVPSPELRRQSEAQERQLLDDVEKHTCNEDASQSPNDDSTGQCV